MDAPTSRAAAATRTRTEALAGLGWRPFLVVLGGTLAMLGVAISLWYGLKFEYKYPWAQPFFMAGGTLVFLALLRAATGVRWTDLSREGRFTLLTSLALFSVLWVWGRMGTFHVHLRDVFPDSSLRPLYPWFYFATNCLLARTVVPLALIWLWFRKRPRDFGYGLRGTPSAVDLPLPWATGRTVRLRLSLVYTVLWAIVAIVVVFYASRLTSFQAKYPMSRAMIHDNTIALEHFLLYQAFYGLIFLSGESFWRGYIIFGLERDLRWYGLVFMIIPYVMAHFGKPVAETSLAALTGLVLGWLALAHRSWWLGFAVHWGVALVMDVSAVWRRGIEIGMPF